MINKLIILTVTFIVSSACASVAKTDTFEEFNYKPAKIGFGEEGYEQRNLSDKLWEVKIIAMKSYPKEVLVHYFNKRASEICNGKENYKVINLDELIDICSEGGCFESAVQGVFECVKRKTGQP